MGIPADAWFLFWSYRVVRDVVSLLSFLFSFLLSFLFSFLFSFLSRRFSRRFPLRRILLRWFPSSSSSRGVRGVVVRTASTEEPLRVFQGAVAERRRGAP